VVELILASAAPGRDSSNWSATNEVLRFKPNGPSAVTFQWLQGTTQSVQIPLMVQQPTTTYTEASYNVCE
jgi:hypothetical protein